MFNWWGCAEIQKSVKDCCTIHQPEVKWESPDGQAQVFTFYKSLPPARRDELDHDFGELEKDLGNACECLVTHFSEALSYSAAVEYGKVAMEKPHKLNWELKKVPTMQPGANLTRLADVREKKMTMFQTRGFELYSKGHVAIVLLAGGFNGHMGGSMPKGAMDAGLQSNKSTFQLYAERIRRLQHLVHRKFHHQVHIPLYIMCNKSNRDATAKFFKDYHFFGLQEKDILFFTQSYHPAVDKKGKMLLS